MDDRTRKALKGSIAKWEAIVAGTSYDKGTDNCPLCILFYDDHCYGCPVAIAAKKPACTGTPYTVWSGLVNHKPKRNASTLREIQAAQAELDFLRGLLSSEPTP